MIIKKCSWCGKEIKVAPSKNSKHIFCNKECYLKYHSRDTKKCKCEICGKIFKSTHKDNANRFCSRTCYDKLHNIKNKQRKCLYCEKEFTALTSEDKYCCRTYFDEDRKRKTLERAKNNPLKRDKRDTTEYKN